MPSETPKQHRAMEAAAHGHSTLGIPKKVGKEFVAADAAHSSEKASNPGRQAQSTDHMNQYALVGLAIGLLWHWAIPLIA
jgi:hypothetical protein